jgi:N-acetylmuramoyl-L-alanine amidase-like protein
MLDQPPPTSPSGIPPLNRPSLNRPSLNRSGTAEPTRRVLLRRAVAFGGAVLVVGAQTLGHNEHTIGIENEGLYTSASPTSALWNTLVESCAYLCDVYGLAPATAIVGHRNYVATACPGDRLYGMLPKLRQDVAAALGKALSATAAANRLPDLGAGRPPPRHTFDHGPAA